MTRTNITEEELIRLLSSKDQEGMSILYDNYSAALYGVIFRIIPTQEIAEDLLQETFLRIWKNFSKYDSSKGRLFTWMTNIARNITIDRLRSKDHANSQKNRDLENLVYFFDKGNNHSYNPDVIGLKELVQKLEPEHIAIIELLYFNGFTQAEAAEKLNIPLGTIKTRSRAALQQLRKLFEK